MLKFTIITPSLNQGKYLEETIISVIKQNYGNLEYIIIDGGSTDNSLDIIKMYEKQISYWVSEPDNGQSHAVNKGLHVATGEIIGWLNADDRYYRGAIQKACRVFIENPDIDVVFGNVDFINENGKILHRTNEIAADFRTYVFTDRCYHANAAGFFRKRCFDLYGGLSEKLTYTMDYELYLRFAYNRCRFYQVRDVLGSYRLHTKSKTLMNARAMTHECRVSSGAYKGELGISPVFYGPLKYYYKFKRIVKKIYSFAYSPGNLVRGALCRWKYSP